MQAFKALAGAFIAGGALAIVGQLCSMAAVAILGADSFFLAAATLIAMGAIGAALFVAGAYQKIEKAGGFGAIMPLSGLAAAIAGTVAGAKNEGASTKSACWAGAKLGIWVLGTGSLAAAIIAGAAFCIG